MYLQKQLKTARQTALVTTSWFPKWHEGKADSSNTDKVRGDLALETIDSAIRDGYRVYVADLSTSSYAFHKELVNRQVQLVPRHTQKGVEVPGRLIGFQNGIREALNNPDNQAFVLMQIEKNLAPNCLPMITAPLIFNQADIVIPKRNEQLFRETYPSFQYSFETDANRVINQLLHRVGYLPDGSVFDFFFGVWAFAKNANITRDVASKIFSFTDENSRAKQMKLGYEITFFPVIKALKEGKQVISVEVPFRYPPEQRKNETDSEHIEVFKLKRKQQHDGIIKEVKQYLRFLESYV